MNSHPEVLNALRESRSAPKKDSMGRLNVGSLGKKEFQDKATSSDISFWIDDKSDNVLFAKDFLTKRPEIVNDLRNVSSRKSTGIISADEKPKRC